MKPTSRAEGCGSSGGGWLSRRHIAQPVGRIPRLPAGRHSRKVGITRRRGPNLTL